MDGYNDKSCNALEKPFYRPVEAALRWCGLIKMESMILGSLGDDMIPKTGSFPQWPCLQANTEKILDAIMHGEIPHGRDGKTVAKQEHVARPRLTIRHSDLKEWMSQYYPDQKPAFLFDEIERKTHKAIDSEAFQALQVERDSLKARIEKAEVWAKEIMKEKESLIGERDSLRVMVDKAYTPDQRSETTYLNIIGGLMGLLLGETPSGNKHSVFESQAAIIQGLLSHYPNKSGISQRTLESKFSEAKKSLSQ